jgi:hypothetical protein
MRWHRLAVVLALAGCGTAQECPLVGCVSELTVRLPAGVTAAQGCVEGVCSTEIRAGNLVIPLGRKSEGTTAQVTVSTGTMSYAGEVPLVRTRPNGPRCPPDCVNGSARVDAQAGTVVPA